jgi:RHS repeat-associated protein
MTGRAALALKALVGVCALFVVTAALPPGYSVKVTPDGTSVTQPPSSGPFYATFFVKNTGTYTDTYDNLCFGRVNINCEGIDVPFVTLDPGDQIDVEATYSTAATTGLGRVVVKAYGSGVTDSGYYRITVSGPPAGYSVAVTPDGASQPAYGSSTGNVTTFTVTNTGTQGTLTYALSIVGCSTPLSNCTSDSASVQVAQGASKAVSARYDVQSASGTGTLTIRAVHMATGAQDNGSLNVTIVPPLVARDLCLTVAAGSATAFECGDLRVMHGIPPVRTLGTTRTPVLLYNSQHAHPYPLVRADVTLPAGDPLPTTVQAILIVNGVHDTTTWAGSAWGSAGQTRRIAVGLDALNVVTGLYPYTLAIHRITGQSNTVLQTFTGTLPIVNRNDSPFGAGWWLAGFERLSFTGLPAGQVMWIGGDGSVRRYDRVGPVGTDTVYLASAVDHPDTLLRKNSGRWVRLLPGGAKVKFSSAGIHDSTTNRLGYSTTFTDSSGYLTRITVPPSGAGLSFAFGYTGTPGKLATVAAPDSAPGSTRVTTVSITSGRVQSITDPGSAAVQFAYDPGFTNRIISRTDRRGAVWRYAYDAGHRLASAKLGLGAGANDTIAVTFCAAEVRGLASCSPTLVTPDSAYAIVDGPRTDSADVNHVWTDDYGVFKVRDPYGNLTTVTRGDARWPAVPTRSQVPSGHIMSAAYDGRGNLASVTDSNPYGTGVHPTTSYQWHQQWDAVTLITFPNGQLTRFEINAANGNVNWMEDARGAVSRTTFTYYATGTCIGMPQTATAPHGGRDSLGYDARCNTSHARTPVGYVTSSTNDRVGRTTRVVRPAGSGTREDSTIYDSRDRIIRTVAYGPAMNGAPAQTLTVRSFYDDESYRYRVERSQIPNPTGLATLVTQWVFDLAGRPIIEIAPDGKRDSTWHDHAGNVDSVRTRRGHVIRHKYDRLNRVTRRIAPAVAYPVRSIPNAFDHDSSYSPRLRTFPQYPNDVAYGYRIPADTATFAYDSSGALATANNGDARVTRTYYRNGMLRTDELRTRTVASLSQGGSFDAHVYLTTYGYDVNGRLSWLRYPYQIAPRDAGGVLRDSAAFGYNALTGLLESVREPLGATTTLRYDYSGRPDTLLHPGGIVERRSYDSDSRLQTYNVINNSGLTGDTAFTTSTLRGSVLSYQSDGRLIAVRDTSARGDTVDIAYSGMGHMRSLQYSMYLPRTFPSGTDRVTGLTVLDGDALANDFMTSTRLTTGAAASNDTATVTFEQATGRMASALRGGCDIWGTCQPPYNPTTYHHDSAGNVEWIDHTQSWMGPYTATYYGADQRLRAVDTRVYAARAVFDEFRYDALGRQVFSRSRKEHYLTAYDDWDTGLIMSAVRRTIWAGDRILGEIQMPGAHSASATLMENDTARVVHRPQTFEYPDSLWWLEDSYFYGRVAYIHGQGLDQPLSVVRMGYGDAERIGGTLGPSIAIPDFSLAPHWDARGNVDNASFSTGSKNSCRSYQSWRVCVRVYFSPPWQAAEVISRTPLNAWHGSLLEGQQTGSGLVYQRHRYFDPSTGRFTQEDPIGLAGGLNLYGFAAGDPVNFSDPFGLCPPPLIPVCAVMLGFAWFGGSRIAINAMYDRPLNENVQRDAGWGMVMGLGAGSLAATPVVAADATATTAATGAAPHVGRHAGWVAEMAKRTPGEIARSIRSLERVAAQHAEWIRNPTSKIPDFYQRSAAEQASLLRQWGQTIVDRTQQANLLRDLRH